MIDDSTLLLPDRPGNRRADSMSNILADGRVGLIAMMPGMNETLRINGHGWIVDDAGLLAASAVNGRSPRLGIWIHVEELYFHCAKALVRSRLWDPARHVDRSEFPGLGRMILDQVRGRRHAPEDEVVRTTEAALERDARDNLY